MWGMFPPTRLLSESEDVLQHVSTFGQYAATPSAGAICPRNAPKTSLRLSTPLPSANERHLPPMLRG